MNSRSCRRRRTKAASYPASATSRWKDYPKVGVPLASRAQSVELPRSGERLTTRTRSSRPPASPPLAEASSKWANVRALSARGSPEGLSQLGLHPKAPALLRNRPQKGLRSRHRVLAFYPEGYGPLRGGSRSSSGQPIRNPGCGPTSYESSRGHFLNPNRSAGFERSGTSPKRSTGWSVQLDPTSGPP